MPLPTQAITPYSWTQFKQDFGVYDANTGNDVSLPGTATVVGDSAQVFNNGGFTGAALTAGQEIEGWLLGDIGPTTETPIPKNYLRDANSFLTGGYSGVDTWEAPFYNLTNSSQGLATVTIDNDNEFDTGAGNYVYNAVTYPYSYTYNAFTNDIGGTTNYSVIYGTYVDGTYAGTWTGAPTDPLQNNPANGAPPSAAGAAPSEANGWQSSQGDTIYEQNYYITGYRRTINNSTTASNGLIARHNASGQLNVPTALATWAFGVPNTAATPVVLPPTTAPATPQFNTFTNSTTPPIATDPTSTTGSLVKVTPNDQSYDAFVWFPSQDASGLSTNPELHITDAEYNVQVVNPYNYEVLSTQTAYVDQTVGGSWVKIAGPFDVPIVTNPGNTAQSGSAIVVVTLDNTTDMTVNNVSVTQLPDYYVVADAVQVRPDNGYMYSSPVAVNISDYPELAGGYQDGGVDANGVDIGGYPATYRASQETLSTAATASQQAAQTSGGNYFPLGAVPNGEYTEDQWGNKWANAPTADPVAAVPATVALTTAAGAGRPIDQVVYVTRSENLTGFENGLEQTIGAVYAIDGLTGNVIWRYPSVLPFVTNDFPGAPAFTTAGASTNTTNAPSYQNWQPIPSTLVPIPPDNDYYGQGYNVINAENYNDASDAVATWTPQSLTTTAQNYYVYVWFPSQTTNELHITDAQYKVAGVTCNTVNQQAGGHWVQLTQNGTNNPVFSLAAGATITLANTTLVTPMTGGEPVGYYVVANAVLIVPTNAPGPITSSPVVVRNMRVIVDPTNTTNPTYSYRTCVLFADNSTGGTNLAPVSVLDDAGGQFVAQSGAWNRNLTTPDTNYYNTGYSSSASVASTTSPGYGYVQWTPANLPGTPTNYYIYVWYPKAAGTDTHIDDAQYGLVNASTEASLATINTVDQTKNGGQWVQLTWQNGANDPKEPVFNIGAGVAVTLSNLSADATTGTVVADAVMFVPVTSANVSGGGHVYCLDAAGNGDGDDTVVDQNGEPVAYDQYGNLIAPPTAPAAFSYVGPLRPLQYGTTKAYWIWQPNPNEQILQTRAGETPETVPDADRDMPIPGAYELNSPSVKIYGTGTFPYGGDTNPDQGYSAVVYIGNSNGYLYALDGQGIVNSATDQNLFYQTLDPTMPTVDVYWWFGTGQSIAYAPVVGADHNIIYTTTYSPDGANQGRVYAVWGGTYNYLTNDFNNAITDLVLDRTDPVNKPYGPVGNFGKGDPTTGANPDLPGALNYNLEPIPYWSFPDGYGTIKDANGNTLPATEHLVTSQVTSSLGGKAPVLPLGDIAGAPSMYTDTNGHVRIYISANEPTPYGVGPGANGRVYAINASAIENGVGTMAWVYPDTNGDPNTVGNTTQQATVFDYVPNTANPNALPHQPLGGPFTVFDPATNLFVSSSPVEGQVTFPLALFPTGDTSTTNLSSLPDQNVQMLYTGGADTGGTLYALNIGPALNGITGTVDDDGTNPNIDTVRLIYNQPIGDGPIYSTPAMLAGSAQNASSTSNNNVGGVVFLTSSVGNIWEVEATPFTDPTGNDTTTPLVNIDWGWSGPGGLSSPAFASFDVTGFDANAYDSGNPSTVAPPASPGRDDSEWLYAGSDSGFLYGFTPNTSTGGDFFPGNFIPTQNIGPNSNMNLTRNMVSEVFYGSNPVSGGIIDWDKGGHPPANPAFDWGQTVWIAIGGIDNPAVNNGTTYPAGISLSFNLVQPNGVSAPINLPLVAGDAYPVNVNDPHVAKITGTTFPPTQTPPTTAVTPGQEFGVNLDGNYYAYVYGPYYIGPTHPAVTANGQPEPGSSFNPATPGSQIQVANITERAVSNGAMITVNGSTRPNLIVNTGASGSKSSSYGFVAAVDQATFAILNPLGVAGGGAQLGGGLQSLAISSSAFNPTPQVLGPFNGVDGTTNNNFPAPNGFQMADNDGNNIPIAAPVGGTITTSSGTTINPTLGNGVNGNNIATTYEPVDIIADPGLIGHGTTGDTGTGNTATPNPALGLNQASVLNNPMGNGGVASTYGSSMFVVADRSALGLNGGLTTSVSGSTTAITGLRMDSPQFVWNDNTASDPNVSNASAVINMLPWDVAPPTSYTQPNYSADYPSLPSGNVHVELIPRTDSATNSENGTQGDITQAPETLANSPASTASATDQADRTIRPNPVLVQVQVPKFQPANLESYDDGAFGLTNGSDTNLTHSHVENSSTTMNPSAWVPQGYIAETERVYVDEHGTGTFQPDDAYRDVNIWVGVPVDMSMAIGQPTTDVGALPAGFGLWNPDTAGGTAESLWSPYTGSASNSGAPEYLPYFTKGELPIYNTGNVNLLNVHFDQAASYSNNAYLSAANWLSSTEPLLDMSSDTVTDQLTSPPNNQYALWPFMDTTGMYAGTWANFQGTYLVRSNLDYDVDLPALMNPSENNGSTIVPGPTAHKARIGDPNQGALITVPDEPHDGSNADYLTQSQLQSLPSSYYNQSPVLSVAIPLGTPVGTYAQTVRTFEGSDYPYDPLTGPTYGAQTATGSALYPYYYIPGVWNSPGSVLDRFIIDSTTGSPDQFYSDPGTVLVAHVTEDRLTDDAPIIANVAPNGGTDYESGTLPMIDQQRVSPSGTGTGSGATQAGSNDIQPWAFADTSQLAQNNEPSLGLLWPSQRAFSGAANAASSPSLPYDIFGAALNGTAGTNLGNGTALTNPTSAASWWVGLINGNGPDDITNNGTLSTRWLPSGTTSYFTSYSPSVVSSDNLVNYTVAGPDTGMAYNTALRVDSVAGTTTVGGNTVPSVQGAAPNYAIAYSSLFQGAEPPANSWNNYLLPTSTTPIFGPRGCYVEDTALLGNPLIIFWSETSGGRSQIFYQSPHATSGSNTSTVDGAPLIPATTPNPVPAATPGVLEIPAGVSSVSNPTPVTRPFGYPWPNAAGTAIQYWPAIDVTYSGVSALNGETDVYTSRYIVWQDSSGTPVLKLVPFGVQPGATSTTISESPVSETLTPNSANNEWEAQDVGWLRDPATFTLWYTPANPAAPQWNGVNPPFEIINPQTLTAPPVYDRSSGEWIYNNVTLPDWTNGGASNTTGTVYVNPDQGTVRFSTAPSAYVNGNTTTQPTFSAAFVPQALRATLHSGTNTSPVAFIDEAGEPNTLQLPAGSSQTAPQPVIASRYWYVWRKAGAGAGSAQTNGTLYFKTRRLTVVLAYPIAYAGNVNNTTSPPALPSVTITLPNGLSTSGPFDYDPGHYIYQNSGGSLPQMVPGRIYFPDWVKIGGQYYSTEGAQVTVTYTPEPYELNGNYQYPTGGGGTITQQTPGIGTSSYPYLAPIQWMDEPYTNSPTDTAFRAGERQVPISAVVNEGEPCAFLDPVAYWNNFSANNGNPLVFPHRVWLFWVSTRNASGGTSNGTPITGTGADLYWEAIDPRFSTTSPP